MPSENEKKKRDRSPAFPYVSLEIAVERLSSLYSEYSKHSARIGNIAPVWGLSPGSSTPVRTVAALKSFGLVDVSGSGEERKVSVSKLGFRILNDQREGARAAAIKEAFYNCEILADYYERWAENRPPDKECISELTIDANFTNQAATKFINVYDASVQYAELACADSISETPQNKDGLDNYNAEKNSVVMDSPAPTLQPTQTLAVPRETEVRQDTFSLDTGDVVIQWPKEITKENYEDFVAWVEILIRKVGRCVKQTHESEENNND